MVGGGIGLNNVNRKVRVNEKAREGQSRVEWSERVGGLRLRGENICVALGWHWWNEGWYWGWG